MEKVLICAVLILALQACATDAPQGASQVTSDQPVTCPSSPAEYDSLHTETQVIKCFGKSSTVTSKPDGRHTALYEVKKGTLVVFLFDKDGSVIRNRLYQDNGAQ